MNIDYQQLAQEMVKMVASGVGQKAVSSTPTSNYAHGRGGLFATPGLSRELFSTMILPNRGLQSKLPTRTTNETDPLYGIITGVTASTGSEPDGVCDDPPEAGLTKLCEHTFPLGRYSRQTRVFDLDRAGKRTNRGEFWDFNVNGNPFNNTPAIPTMPGGSSVQGAARSEINKALFEFAVAWSRDFARQIYTGNPTNNTANGGYREFYGLDTLINTGYRDAITGVACPAADSIVRSFSNADVESNGASIVREITYIYRNLKYIATHAGLNPAQWQLSMSFGLFYALTDIWPCSYLSYRCNVSDGSTQFIQAGEAEQMRDNMRGDIQQYTGQYLLIDGERVPVCIDDTITEAQLAGGTFTSDIYFVPMTVVGGTPVTFLETFNYDVANGAMEMANVFAPGDSYYTTDGGRFLWHKKPPTNFCVQLLAKMEPRLLLLTPYIAARLTDVGYTPIIHERSWDPSDASFFVNGGKTATDTTQPSYFSPTS